MVASQPKQAFWGYEIIPLDGAAESSKKQMVVDLAMTMGMVSRDANVGTLFLNKLRRGQTGAYIRIKTDWARCRLYEIDDNEYYALKSQFVVDDINTKYDKKIKKKDS